MRLTLRTGLSRYAQSLRLLPNSAFSFTQGYRPYRTEPPACRSAAKAHSISYTCRFAIRPSPQGLCRYVGACVIKLMCIRMHVLDCVLRKKMTCAIKLDYSEEEVAWGRG